MLHGAIQKIKVALFFMDHSVCFTCTCKMLQQCSMCICCRHQTCRLMANAGCKWHQRMSLCMRVATHSMSLPDGRWRQSGGSVVRLQSSPLRVDGQQNLLDSLHTCSTVILLYISSITWHFWLIILSVFWCSWLALKHWMKRNISVSDGNKIIYKLRFPWSCLFLS